MKLDKVAMLVVDVQNDFCRGGALAVPDGDAVVPVINRVAARFAAAGRPVFASRDWHPADSRHFVGQGGRWPPHCVQGTAGAWFHPLLELPEGTLVVSKGYARDADGYDAFEGTLEGGVPLADALRERSIERLVVAGLATDYCVKRSALGARRLGLDVMVLADGIRAVNAAEGDGDRAIAEMREAGVRLTTSAEVTGAAVGG